LRAVIDGVAIQKNLKPSVVFSGLPRDLWSLEVTDEDIYARSDGVRVGCIKFNQLAVMEVDASSDGI
jgi:hypothetical protein